VKIILPDDALYIISTLENNGYETVVVGGSVRDALLGKVPNDWDIATAATPEQSISCFSGQRIIETGLKHGTITLLLNNKPYEITTFRTDGIYKDNRRPETVQFTGDLKSDLARRDFTINALAYTPQKGIIDFFGGIDDINNRKIRCVGNAAKRFEEDALRIMRAMRFSATLEFGIESATKEALKKSGHLLNNIAKERISDELNKLLCGRNVGATLLEYSEIIGIIIPEIIDMIGFEQNTKYHDLDVWNHTVKSVGKTPSEIVLRLTLLLHDIAKPSCYTYSEGKGHFHGHQATGAEMAKRILSRLKYDNDTIQTVTTLILFHDAEIVPENKAIKRWLNRLGEPKLRLLLEVKKADAKAQAEKFRHPRIEMLDEAKNVMDKIVLQQQCFAIKDLAIGGNDLLALGVPPGIQIGEMLSSLLDMVVDEKIENDKAQLLEKAQELSGHPPETYLGNMP